MKRIYLVALILVLVLPTVFADGSTLFAENVPAGDTRAQGLAGAMTAVNDDMNTLFYNPAGLAFLRKSYFNLELNIGGAGSVADESSDAYNYTTETASASSMATIQPHIVMGGPSWGVALTSDYIGYIDYTETGSETDMHRKLGAVAGLGFKLGPIAVGANAKCSTYYSQYGIVLDGANSDFGEFLTQVLIGDGPGVYDSYDLSVGLGAIVTFGSLNFGIYNDNILPFLEPDYSDDYVSAFMSTMSFGVSLMPSDDKFSKDKFPLVFLASADLKNFGNQTENASDPDCRQLSAGVEAGLNAWESLVATVRLGYSQPLPGTYMEMLSQIDPYQGTAVIGATAKLWFAQVDMSLSLPMEFLMDDSTANGVAMKYRVSVTLAF